MRESQIYLTNVSEQNKIGSLISKLDKLLTLQQRKVTLFKQLKGSLLDSLISGKDTPLVRFNEFKSKWTLFTLKDIVTKTIKGSAKAEMHGKESIYLDTHYLNGGNPSMVNSPTNVSSNDIIILWDGSQAGKVYHGFTGALGSTLKSYTPKYSSDYLFQYLKKYQNKIFANYRTPNIPHVIKDFATVFKVNLPSTKEQIIISSLLKTLDVQITTENTSVNHLKNIKQFLLQNMFI
ncbi:Type I restriction-modification system specificity subunit [Lactobacillus taiwanensis DSM 21401]|uniref:restriction endonuclease subunit S n=1 Tax=Lactobacillus taiwanensis TaxID=508451 RepID=UPI0006EE8E16|nr:restriction endonuclease subunit S [Lactobacillus taiwanensis]KRM98052.1 Type I restriction-modification system specificity subunit [Lactobacillus taiwanensis DSM 21401]